MPSTNGHGSMRVVLYARVSTDEQARSGYSLAQQLEALRSYAESEGYEVLEEVVDPGQSGASLARPGMDRVRDLVATKGVSVVLVQDRDRFAREPAYHYLLKKEFEEHRTKIRALNDRGDESPEGELTDGIIDQIAKFERAKTAERTRRGKLRKAREGKILAGRYITYGFKLNEERDAYVVDEDAMRVVRRIFYMFGVEGVSINGIKRTLQREGVKTPSGRGCWSTKAIRSFILDDVYRPHTCEEVACLVSSNLVARLDQSKHYGIWWFNRQRVSSTQVSEVSEGGRRYRKKRKLVVKPKEEWIAVPVPDSGIPREVVDATREAIADNRRVSNNGERFWELSGGILRCGSCGCRMRTNVARNGKSAKRHYYYLCTKHHTDATACPNRKSYRADRLEPDVWRVVSGLLTSPEQLRADLEAMIEGEREGMHGDPDREARAWLEKLVEVERKRSGYIDLAADGIMDRSELREKLAALEETRETASQELEALRGRREKLEELERDKDALLESYAGVAPKALNTLLPDERHRIYGMLRLKVVAKVDGGLEVSGALGENVCTNERTSARTPRETCSWPRALK